MVLFLKHGAVFLALGFAVLLFWRSIEMATGPAQILLIVAAALPAYLLGDLVAGIIHWASDRLGSEDTPVLGKMFILPFREHHQDPQKITTHDFFETNGNSCIAALPFVLAAWLYAEHVSGPSTFFVVSMLTWFSLTGCITNQIHKWSHMTNPPKLARFLQHYRLILTPQMHQIHHRPPRNTYYCITNGWLNAFYSRIRLFERMESFIGGIRRDRNI